jgi:shikimate dehydrogenase
LAGGSVGIAAVLGSPVAHSLSPVLHRAAYAALGLTEWRYEAIECAESGLAPLLAGSAPAVVGYSCTMPLKRQVLAVATSASSRATAIGAGNTLLRVAAGWHADNTDWRGIRDALFDKGITAPDKVVILGAGGTAQAALAALSDAHEITVLVREPARATELLATAKRLAVDVRVARLDAAFDRAELVGADLVISTLPARAADPLAVLPWHSGQALLDVIYHPWPTELARSAGQGGATVISGASLLLYQAAGQVELMTERTAPVEAMRAALLAASPACGA